MSKELRVVALGEILWDLFPSGAQFGGAPANFSSHIAAHGGHATLVSAVGNDALGQKALDVLQAKNVDTSAVQQLSDFPTGQVQVQVDEAGKASFHFGDDEAWDHISTDDTNREHCQTAAAICFGTLGQRHPVSRTTIRELVRSASPNALRVLDINLRPPYYDIPLLVASMELANVLKLNDEEFDFLRHELGFPGSESIAGQELLKAFSLEILAITKGVNGATIFRGEQTVDQPGEAVKVQDTVGAGDSFTATLTLALLQGRPLSEVLERACHVAAYVCTQPGGTPVLPESLRL